VRKTRREHPGRAVAAPARRRQRAATTGTASSQPVTDARTWLLGLGLVALVAFVYAPVRHYGFVDLDDPQYVSENPFVANGLTWAGVKWAFTSVHASYWLPLIWLSHMFDVQLYGLHAGGHHVTNVVLHATNALLLLATLYRATGAVGRSVFVAAVFAIHPLHVESVVWITERKDVLSTMFLFLTLWVYVEYVRRPATWRYLLGLVLFALGLMSKPMVVTLPFVLLLLDVWPLERVALSGSHAATARGATWRRLVLEKLPFLALGAIGAVIAFVTQQATGAVVTAARIPFAIRLANASQSYVTYALKAVWPSGLALFYPYPLHWSWPIAAASVAALAGVSGMAVWRARRYPYLAIGWLWYLGTLVPVIGLVQAGDQARADRFTYIPLVGLCIMVAWGTHDLIARTLWRWTAVAATVALAIVARRQVGHWRNNTELWEHALRVADESYIAHTNLGLAVYARGLTDSAIVEFRAAVRLRPNFAEAYNDLGVALANRGDLDGAVGAFDDAIRFKPSQAESHYNVAVLLVAKGDTGKAVAHLQTALRLKPAYADAHDELQRLMARRSP